MFNVKRQELEWGGKKLTLETGKIARQADGAVVVTYGDTVVLCTAVVAKKARAGADFFPLTVHYQEKTYAAGKIPGGFFKREAKPTEKETLVSRLIDRPIRPLFGKGFFNEVQVVCTVLSFDPEADSDIPALIGASAALAISGAPFKGPIGACRVGYADGSYSLNPTAAELAEGELDLVVAGTKDGVLMVESEAKQLSEEIMLGAVEFGHKAFQEIITIIEALKADAGKTAMEVPTAPAYLAEAQDQLTKGYLAEVQAAYKIADKMDRYAALDVTKTKAKEAMKVEDLSDDEQVMFDNAFKAVQSEVVRTMVLKDKVRLDGRKLDQVRQIQSDTSVLPRTHGSALFTRGETQAMAVTTLGTGQDEQMIDSLEGERKENFILHYNFPPYSVGECGRMMGPGRREIGHGKLAWRSLRPVLPAKEDFPYTIRLVSEITESNGSSSMATVCGGSLSMMDAGVPLTSPVSGIAMGLVKEGDDFAVLSDILGDEDHLGDMDFKVAGSEAGITSLQMDLKITSVTIEIMKIALDQAKGGRLHILSEMMKSLEAPRTEMSDYAPRLESIQVNKDKIRDIIGTGGKVIREICEVSGAKVDINDEGLVTVSSIDRDGIDKAMQMIKDIVTEPEIGQIYKGKVTRVLDFGAIVNYMGSREGMVHISELANERVEKVTDVVNLGDEVRVKLLAIEDRGKVRLSIKKVKEDAA